MSLSRREFLALGIGTVGAAGLGWWSLGQRQRGPAPPLDPGYGPLRPVADATTGIPLLALPEGFRYLSFGWAGHPMSDGAPTPGAHDGMGVVAERGGIVTLVRNHELRAASKPLGSPDDAWDVTGGGTTTLMFDTRSEGLEASWVSLGGTLNNCAGGVTPWGTWLSCEEGVYTPALSGLGVPPNIRSWRIDAARRTHGWVFEVPADGVAEARPLRAMGQFYHEAAAVDPENGIVYMTEDRSPEAGFYRFIPTEPGRLEAGGRLQMMAVEGVERLNDHVDIGRPLSVGWVDIGKPEQGHRPGTHDTGGVVAQGLDAGGTAFRALEGIALDGSDVVFTAKAAGRGGNGAVFRYEAQSETLTALYEAGLNPPLSGPDNLAVSPRGATVICEDRLSNTALGPGQFLAGLTSAGTLFYFARVNAGAAAAVAQRGWADMLRSEWAGACFSADGQWLFVNVQNPGVTFAITGPWQSGLI